MAALPNFRIAISTAIVISLATSLGVSDAAYFSNIEGRSFSLISTVKSTAANGSVLFMEFDEHYSIEQKRARIESKITKKTNRIIQQSHSSWIVDSEQNLILEYDRGELKCSLSSARKIKDTFNLYLPETEDIDKHVVGPAIVILFVEKHGSKMAFVKDTVVRNLHCLLYKLDYDRPDGGGIISFVVYYSELSMAADRNALPLRIEMSQDGKPFMEFDYLQVRPLTESINQASKMQVKLDPLRLEPLVGCSKLLVETNSIDLFQTERRFSFEAIYESTISRWVGLNPADRGRRAAKMKSFVAYDSELNSMLVESTLQQDNRAAADGASSREILNFRLNRMYRVAVPDKVDFITYYGSHDQQTNSRFRQCTVSKIIPEATKNVRMSIGRLLVGTDKFVYMGKARVRGIEAKFYEAQNVTELPYWITQPIAYVESLTLRAKMQRIDTTRIYLNLKDSTRDPKDVIRSVILYFGEKEASHPLVLIEIYIVDSASHDILIKKSIQVHNFAWDLTESANGDRVSDLFSLRDSCTDHKGAYAKMELLLESDEVYDQDELRGANIFSPAWRNLALLSSLQKELNLPSQMVFDMETTIVSSALSDKQAKNFLKMVASFNVAVHTETMVELIYVGQGLQDDSKVLKYSRSFQDCFHLAAHQREQVYFGYNNQTGTCYLDNKPVVLKLKPVEEPDSFQMFESGPVEVYRTYNRDETFQLGSSYWTREVYEENAGFDGNFLKIVSAISPSKDSIFKIRSAKKEYFNPIAPPHKTIEAAVNLTGASFVGFGLPKAKGNRPVQASTLEDLIPITTGQQQQQQSIGSDSGQSHMTFDQCHSACLSDFECQSFSTCIRNAQVECMISKTSFKSAHVVDQLEKAMKTAADGKRQKGTLTVKLDDRTSVELYRHPTCELRNKNFFELFRKMRETQMSLRFKALKAVDGRNGCADMCFMQNLELLKQDAAENSALFESCSPEDKAVHSNKVQSIIKKHRQTMKNFCRNFYYFDKRQIRLRKEADEIESKIGELMLTPEDKKLAHSNTTRGFCVVPEPENHSANHFNDLFRLFFEVEVYEFKVEFFYERHYGIGIKESVLTEEQYASYYEVEWKGDEASERALSDTRDLIDRGVNFVALFALQPAECAWMCFSQVYNQIWPACRSFDIFQDRSSIRCQLNTITLAQARARGNDTLISMPSGTTIWHYEPKAGFVLDESMLSGYVELAEESLISRLKLDSALGVRFHFFGCLLIVIVGLASGIAFGLWSGQRIRPTTDSTFTKAIVDIELVE